MDVTAATDRRSLRRGALAYAELVRLPNVFTAPPDVVAGAALVVATVGTTVSVRSVAGLAVASALLYAGGTTLNDYFDADVDADERPERPIPSGRISRGSALAFGFGLLVAGVALAAAVAGAVAGAVAAGIASLVVAYDGYAKCTSIGFAVMGATRGANVLLGTSVIGASAGGDLPSLPAWALLVPVAVTAYVAAITWMAADEAHGGDSTVVGITAGVAALVALFAPVVTVVATDGWLRTGVSLGLAGAFLAFVGRPFLAARADPTPGTVGRAVGKGVVGLVILQAAVAAVAGPRWSAAALAFLLPAVGLARSFDVS